MERQPKEWGQQLKREEHGMRKRLFTLVAVVAIVATACSNTSQTTSPTIQPTGTGSGIPDLTTSNYKAEAVGHTGGNLILSEWQEPVTAWWNIYDNSATDVEAFGISLWGLWNATADYKFYPQLAADVPTIANGGVTITGDKMDVKINLKPGAKWSDGQPITCDDLAYQVTWQLDKDQSGNIQGHPGWEDITGIDGGTGSNCVAHFSKIYEPYLGLWAPLLPAHYLKTQSVKDAVNKLYQPDGFKDAVWSGPYMPTKWAAGAEIDYVPNAQFWSTIKKSTAPFDNVTFRYYASSAAEATGFRIGEADVAMNFNHTDLPSFSNIDPAQVDAIDGTTYEQNSWNFASLTKKFGADGAKALMTALHYAYDKNAIIQRTTDNTVQPTCNFNSPLTWWYKQLQCPAYDVAKANKILDDAGFKTGSDGIRTAPNGTKVELLGCTSKARAYRVNSLTLLASQLQQIGAKLDVKGVPSTPDLFGGWEEQGSDVPCNTTHGNFDVAEFAWVTGIDPVNGIYFLYRSDLDPTLGDHSGQNYIRVKNADLDKMLGDMLRTVDLSLIKTDMWKIQDLYVDPANAFPEIPLYNWKTVILKNTKLHNVVNNATSATNTWNIEDWWREA